MSTHVACAAARVAGVLGVDTARRVEAVEAVVVPRRVRLLPAVPTRTSHDPCKRLVAQRMRLRVSRGGGDVGAARAARDVVGEAPRVSPKVARVTAVGGDVPRRLDKSAHTPVALHQIAHATARRQVARMERAHEAATRRPRQAVRPDAQARETVAGSRRCGPTRNARLAHHGCRRVLADRKRHSLLRGNALVLPDSSNLREDERAAAAPTSGGSGLTLVHDSTAL